MSLFFFISNRFLNILYVFLYFFTVLHWLYLMIILNDIIDVRHIISRQGTDIRRRTPICRLRMLDHRHIFREPIKAPWRSLDMRRRSDRSGEVDLAYFYARSTSCKERALINLNKSFSECKCHRFK